jgi:hypothetical protein
MKRTTILLAIAMAALLGGAASAGIKPSQNGRVQTVEPGTTLIVPDGATLTVAGVTVDADTLAMDGVTASAAEINLIDGAIAGTSVASKALALGANKNTDVLALPVSGLKIGAGAGTAVTSSAAELNLLTGVTASTAELNLTDNMPANITFAAAAGSTNVAEVTITVKDAAGATIAGVFNFDVWLSDAATCAGLTATTASGAVAVKTSSGADVGTLTTKKALRAQTLATGVYILSITDSAKTGFYPCASLPSTGATKVGAQLITGNYG